MKIISSGFTRRGASQESPVNVRAKIFAAYAPGSLTLDVDRKRLSAGLCSVSNVTQVPIRGLARLSQRVARRQWEVGEVCFEVHSSNNTPDGVMFATPFGEFPQTKPNGVMIDMNVDADTRRENLRLIVKRDGLAVASRRFGKPDRQINDMIMGRKSFGEKVARTMELSYAPDKPTGWLSAKNGLEGGAQVDVSRYTLAESEFKPYANVKAKPRTVRELRISQINESLNSVDDAGLAVVLDKAREMAIQYPAAQKANAS